MAVKIRLARIGRKKRPCYRIVVANSRAPRDGDFIEKIGTYNPLLEKGKRFAYNFEKILLWLKKGAVPSDRIKKFLSLEKEENLNLIPLKIRDSFQQISKDKSQ